MYRIFVINIGSSSTKAAYYEDETCVLKENIAHPLEETGKYADVMEQKEYRRSVVETHMRENGLSPSDMDAIVSRGGHTAPLKSGAFLINKLMLDQIASGAYGRHAADVGPGVAFDMCADTKALPLVADTPCTDEFSPVAKLSGHPLFPRQTRFHALSHKATARRYARELGVKYEELNLITIHMGGGITLAAHEKGVMVDGNNGIEGEGPYSTNRSGGLLAQAVIDVCFSGKYTKKEVSEMINGKGGLVAYLGESDVLTVKAAAKTNPDAALYLEGMFYQTCKEAGALAAALSGEVDAILVTGGMAHGEDIVKYISDRLSFIAKVKAYPGENEMESLALGALSVLRDPALLQEMK
ncbi:MAG: butyrate kinase [Oscillospiraceae bacterium]|nr:butyrate kinase [Oscillospiraceae bacterium]